MALNSANKLAWRYTDDDGNFWRKTAEAAIVAQLTGGAVTVGGIAATGAEIGSWPRSWRPRKAYFANQSARRAVVIYTVTAPGWTNPAATLLLNMDADSAVFTNTGAHLGEKKRAATSQTS